AVEGGGVAERRVALAGFEEDEHGQLGQVVAGEHVDGATVDQFARGGQAISVEAGAIGDAQDVTAWARPARGRAAHCSASSGATTTRSRPASTWSPASTCTSETV